MDRFGVARLAKFLAFRPVLPNVLSLVSDTDPRQWQNEREHSSPSERMDLGTPVYFTLDQGIV